MDKGVGKNQKVSSGAFKTEIWDKTGGVSINRGDRILFSRRIPVYRMRAKSRGF
jgi:hypothetical protein